MSSSRSLSLLSALAAAALIGLLIAPLPTGAQSVSQPKIEPALLSDMTAHPLEMIPVILELKPATPPFSSGTNETLANQAVALLNSEGLAFGALSIIDGAAGEANAAEITALSSLPQVAAIEEDSVVRPRAPAGTSKTNPPGQMTSLYPQEVQATNVWQQGGSGLGVTVAVLDSGVDNDGDLVRNGNRVLAHVSFAGPYNATTPDDGGHGTHIAGTIAGDGTDSLGQYIGMAPKADIVDVKVLDAKGNGRMSSVIRGMEWALAHESQFNIRVINLSFGAPPLLPYPYDPFSAAAEIAWRHGIVVVAASGNEGPSSGGVESPGIDPYIITVGSTDDQVTLSLSDDVLGFWTSWGTSQNSTAKPDIIAPGRRVVAPLAPGSTLAKLLPDHIIQAKNGWKYMRLTGTSMSTAVVSGAVALLLQRQPSLTPDQVKDILVSTTQQFGQVAPPAGAGYGLLNARAAWSSTIRGTRNAGLRESDALARTLYPAIYGQPLAWKSLTYLGTNWSGFTWLNLPWNDAAWDNIAWDNIAWDNIAWDNIAWDQTGWDNIAWDNIAWDNSEWDNIAWDSFGYD